MKKCTKMQFIKKIITFVCLMSLTMGLFSCRNDEVLEKYETTETTETIDATKLSGVVHLYTTLEEGIVKSIKAGFEEKYPKMTLEYSYNNDESMRAKVETEFQYDMINAEVLWLDNPFTMEYFKSKDYLYNFDVDKYDNVPAYFKDSDKKYIATNAIGLGVVYNENLIEEKDVPKSFNDLVKKDYGKIVMTNPNSAYVYKYFVANLIQNKKYGEKYFEKLKDKLEFVDGSLAPCDDVDDGKNKIGLAIDMMAHRYIEDTNVKFSYFDKDNIAWFYPIGLTNYGDNNSKALGVAFINYVLSNEGQTILKDNDLIAVSKSVDNYIDTKGLDGKYVDELPKDIYSSYDESLKKFNEIFGLN